MEFDEEDITLIESLENADEARAYIKFLHSEERRHARDIIFIRQRVKEVAERFNLDGDS